MHAAIGGSTNAVVHLLALAGRLGVPLTLKDFDEIARDAPLLVNLMPSGKYLMEDFCYAGGVPAVAKELGPLYRRDAVTVSGKTQGEIADAAKVWNREVIGSLEAPIGPSSGVWVLKGNLCPQGAILKPSAATPALLTHRGRAVVFEDIEDYHARIDDPDLRRRRDLDPGAEGLRAQGLSGHAGGRQHGPAAEGPGQGRHRHGAHLRRADERHGLWHGDPARRARGRGRRARWRWSGTATRSPSTAPTARWTCWSTRPSWRAAAPPGRPPASRRNTTRGWYRLYIDTVLQADTGVDLDFLVGKSSADVTRESTDGRPAH